MATHETSTKWVAQVASPRTDPAFDQTDPRTAEALAMYKCLRTAKRLAAIPLVPGKTPRLWGIRPLEPLVTAGLCDTVGATSRAMLTFLAACHVRRDGDQVVSAHTEGKPPRATEAWLREAIALGGVDLIREVAEVILRREDLGDFEDDDAAESPADPFDRYGLPRGLTLPR